MGLKEILAAKKAAAEALANASKINQEIGEFGKLIGQEALATSDPEAHQQAITDNAAEKEAAPISPLAVEPEPKAEKPLTFAEKLALKRQGVSQAQAVVQKESKPVEIDPALIPEDAADAQAYVDIKTKIHELENKFDDDLKGAMSELKQALKKNPNATELMLDADIGKMVTALRRMTHVAQVEATTKTKTGKTKAAPKAKDVVLTKEEIEAAFDDL